MNNDLYNDYLNEDMKYKKKRKKINNKKTNHKHNYEKVIIQTKVGFYHIGNFCTICNKTKITNYFIMEKTTEYSGKLLLSLEEIQRAYPNLKIVSE